MLDKGPYIGCSTAPTVNHVNHSWVAMARHTWTQHCQLGLQVSARHGPEPSHSHRGCMPRCTEGGTVTLDMHTSVMACDDSIQSHHGCLLARMSAFAASSRA